MNDSADTKMHRRFPAAVIVIVAIAAIILVLWLTHRTPTTDDAYAYADTIDVVPEVAGRIVAMPVHDNQKVTKGELLFRVDPRRYQAALDAAKAQVNALAQQIALTRRSINSQEHGAKAADAAVAAARASARKAAETLRRIAPLLSEGYASPETVDAARTAQRTAKAQLEAATQQAEAAAAAVGGVEALIAQKVAAEAQATLAQVNLDDTSVYASVDGRIASLDTTVGQFVSPAKPVFTLVATDQWYVIANFRETELEGMRPGTPATVYLMGDTHERFDGVIDSMGYAVKPTDGSPLPFGLPQVARTINWVHVSQRFPVRIRVNKPDPHLFRVGASAVAIVHVHAGTQSADGH